MKTGLTQITIAIPDDAVEGARRFCTTWWNGAPETMGAQEASKWLQRSRKAGWGNLAIPLGALLVDVLINGGFVEIPAEETDEVDEGERADSDDSAEQPVP